MQTINNMPTTPEEVTAEWLNHALRPILPEGTAVTSIKVETLNGAGLIGQVARVTLETSPSSTDVPKTLIAKFSNADPSLRELFYDAYLREIYVYQELIDKIDLVTPTCYYSELNKESGQTILLLEDLGHLQTRNFTEGCRLEDAENMMKQFALLHARWWNDPKLKADELLKYDSIVDDETNENQQKWWSTFEEKVSNLLPNCFIPASYLAMGEKAVRQMQELTDEVLQAPTTFTHGDPHLDNLMFGGEPNDPPLVVIDWQTCGEAVGVREIVYFMIWSLPLQLRRQAEHDLIRIYHETLLENRVERYSLEQCWRDYRLGFFKAFFTLNIVVGCTDITQPYTKRFLQAAMPRIISFAEDHNVAEFLT